jgi:hypothetical protein
MSGCESFIRNGGPDRFIPLRKAPHISKDQQKKIQDQLPKEYAIKRQFLEKKQIDLEHMGPTLQYSLDDRIQQDSVQGGKNPPPIVCPYCIPHTCYCCFLWENMDISATIFGGDPRHETKLHDPRHRKSAYSPPDQILCRELR